MGDKDIDGEKEERLGDKKMDGEKEGEGRLRRRMRGRDEK